MDLTWSYYHISYFTLNSILVVLLHQAVSNVWQLADLVWFFHKVRQMHISQSALADKGLLTKMLGWDPLNTLWSRGSQLRGHAPQTWRQRFMGCSGPSLTFLDLKLRINLQCFRLETSCKMPDEDGTLMHMGVLVCLYDNQKLSYDLLKSRSQRNWTLLGK